MSDPTVQLKPYLQIVTGYSGAGKTTVLKALEDNGFFCVDNLPLPLLPAFFEHTLNDAMHQKIALGIDVRNGTVLDSLFNLLPSLNSPTHILFLTASTPELLRRFQETRRRHPLAQGIPLPDAIEQEKQILQPLMEKADLIVDTGNFTIHQLRTLVRTALIQGSEPKMVVSLMSFGFKYGVPQECNYVYDVRALPNPHFIPALQQSTGLDEAVHTFLFGHEQVQEYWNKLEDFFSYTIKKSYEEGRFFIHVAIGCTGGRHRSVALVEELAKKKMDSVTFLVSHRDIRRKE